MAGSTAFSGERIKVVDMDAHFTEPPDLWISRAPAKSRDLVPTVQHTDAGDQRVVNGDLPFGPIGYTVVKRGGGKAYGVMSLATFEDLDEAAYDPAARLKLLDRLGIHQQIVYPNVRRLRQRALHGAEGRGPAACLRHDLQRRDH